jgi:hypothetical protein
MPKAYAASNAFLNLLYRAVAWANIADNAAASPVTDIHLPLATASYGNSSTGSSNEATYTNYARQNLDRNTTDWAAAANGVISNATAVEYPQCGASGNTITSMATCKAAGASDVFHYGDLNASIAVSNQIQPRFPIGAITITET